MLREKIAELEQENMELLERLMSTDYQSSKNDMNLFKNLNEKNILIENLRKELAEEQGKCGELTQELVVLRKENSLLQQKVLQVEGQSSVSSKKLKVIKNVCQKLQSKSPNQQPRGYSQMFEKKQQLKETVKSSSKRSTPDHSRELQISNLLKELEGHKEQISFLISEKQCFDEKISEIMHGKQAF